MNTYVIGEIAALLAVTAVAGILIGWCIKSLLSGRREQMVRADVARDVDHAAADVEQMRTNLRKKDSELQEAMLELQQLRGRDVSLSAGNTTQVEEINDLKVELSRARKALDQNRSEFSAFREEKLQELQSVSNQLASFKTGGSIHDKTINQAHDSIAALRAAARENDKIIESLRARNKEADTTVDNLRSQLKQSETAKHEAIASRQEHERATARLTTNLQDAQTTLEKQKRDYNTMLESKNQDIAKQLGRLEELGNVQSLLKQKEHDFDKLSTDMQEAARKTGSEIKELTHKLESSEQTLADSRTGMKNLQDQLAELNRSNRTQTEQHQQQLAALNDKHNANIVELQQVIDKNRQELQTASTLKIQIENKDAEVVALNDMLRDVSGKRDQSVRQINELEARLKDASAKQQQLEKNEQQMAALATALKQREADYSKLRSETDATKQEAEALRSKEQAALDAERLIANLQTTLKQKDAEVLKLRGTGDNISALNTEVKSLGAQISKRDTDLSDAQLRVKNLTASLKARDSEIQSLRTAAEQQKQVQLDTERLTSTLARRDAELAKLKAEISSIVAEQESEKAKLQSSEAQRTVAYRKLQTEFDKISNARADYERRVRDLQSQLDQQQKQFDEQLKSSELKAGELQPQIATLQTQVSSLSSEKQQLTANLSDAETFKLKITERDAEIRKLQIELKESGGSNSLQTSLQEQTKKVDSLTSAMRERDNEISRLNKVITDNRIGSKQQTSEVNLLKEEIDAQSKLIRSLESQAESTLELHKKIATQSTEIESLRADLHMTQSQAQKPAVAENSSEIARLKQQLAAFENESHSDNKKSSQLQAEIQQLRSSLAQRDSELKNVRATSADTSTDSRSTRVVSTRVTSQSNSKPTTSDKPRLFVRHGESPDSVASTQATNGIAAASTSAENLAGTQLPARQTANRESTATMQRALYTGDGYRLKRPDGLDDLALLPGFNNELADSLRNNDVKDFEQVALWTQREVAHFADRLGIGAAKAEALRWPLAAKEILAGRYRVDTHREAEKD